MFISDVELKQIVFIYIVATGILLLACRHAYQIGVTAQVNAGRVALLVLVRKEGAAIDCANLQCFLVDNSCNVYIRVADTLFEWLGHSCYSKTCALYIYGLCTPCKLVRFRSSDIKNGGCFSRETAGWSWRMDGRTHVNYIGQSVRATSSILHTYMYPLAIA